MSQTHELEKNLDVDFPLGRGHVIALVLLRFILARETSDADRQTAKLKPSMARLPCMARSSEKKAGNCLNEALPKLALSLGSEPSEIDA
ncbi:MAG: hypothetical protein AAFX06_22945 [Planctomycetota bacterium]